MTFALRFAILAFTSTALATAALGATGCHHHHDEPAGQCVSAATNTVVADSCHVASDFVSEPAEIFRAHLVATTSLSGGVVRLVDTFFDAVIACVAENVVDSVVAGLVGADAGTDCSHDFDASFAYTFDAGTYVLRHRASAQFSNGVKVTDTNSHADVHFYFAKDFPGYAKGALVPADIHDPASFLVGAKLATDAKGNAVVAYDRPGPLAVLLGQGATPPNPFPLSADLTRTLASGLEVDGTIHSELMDCNYRTVTDQTLDRTPLTNDLQPKLVRGTSTAIDNPAVQVQAKVWDLTYSLSGAGSPAGHVDFDVHGAPPASQATVTFGADASLPATMQLTCGG